MIIPTKGILPQQALLTVGGQIVEILSESMTVSRAWAEFRERRQEAGEPAIGFDWFILALDLTFVLGVARTDRDGFLVRVSR